VTTCKFVTNMQTFRNTVNFTYSFLHEDVGSRVFRNLDNCTLNYDTMYILLTAIGLQPGGSGTVHIYTQNNTENNTMKQNTQNKIYVTIRIHKHKNKNT
jgi:hypothetical protein